MTEAFTRLKSRVLIIGSTDSGKSSLVKSLLSGTTLTNIGHTEGINVSTWLPEQQYFTSQILLKLKHESESGPLTVELWDTTGKSCCWPILQCYFNEDDIFVITYNWTDSSSIDAAKRLICCVLMKVPGATIVLLATYCSSIGLQSSIQETSQQLIVYTREHNAKLSDYIISELDRLQEMKSCQFVMDRANRLESLLMKLASFNFQTADVDFETEDGFDSFVELLLEIIIKSQQDSRCLKPRPLLQDEISLQLIRKLLEFRQNNQILIPTDIEYLNLKTNEEIIDRLHSDGSILKVPILACEPGLICINPKQLINAMCLIHFSNVTKQFKFEAYRFWPRDSGRRKPDPSLLVKALEEIPSSGKIREVLFPLLWQDVRYTEEQIKSMIKVLVDSGFICTDQSNVRSEFNMEGLCLPNYPSLSATQQLTLPLLANSKKGKPVINWIESTPPDDQQLDFLITFPVVNIPDHVTMRIFTGVYNSTHKLASYIYKWGCGVLCKFCEEVHAHVFLSELGVLTVSSRQLNDGTSDNMAALWASCKHFLSIVFNVLHEYPALIYEVNFRCKNGHIVQATKLADPLRTLPVFPLLDCLYQITQNRLDTEKEGYELNLKKFFCEFSAPSQQVSTDWIKALQPSFSLESLKVEQNSVRMDESNALNNTKNQQSNKCVSWRSEISEEANPEVKAYKESHQSHVVPDKVMRRQIRKIASSIVATAIAKAVAEVFSTTPGTSQGQAQLLSLVASSVSAGSKGETTEVFNNLLSAFRIAKQAEDSLKQAIGQSRSKICIIL